MRRAIIIATACSLFVLAAGTQHPASAAAGCTTSVPFTSGTGGYNTYRIPALVQAGSTTVAFAEGRRSSAADHGDIEVVSRRSTDGGCTWTPIQRVTDHGYDTAGNPAPVVDPATGKIWLLTTWQKGSVTQSQIEAGQVPATDSRRVYVQSSSDKGTTWTAPREITSVAKRSSWRWYATGPGHGIALASGRLVIPANHTAAGVRGAHLLLSDDHGVTWRIGAVDDHMDGVINPDETTVAQLPDGRLFLNTRDQYGTDPANRAFTFSLTNGSTFSAPFRPQPELVAPVVKGTLLQDTGVSCKPLLFSAPQDPTERRNLTIRRSTDGRTWRQGPTVEAGLAGYSDMAKPERTVVSVLYETGTTTAYDRIQLKRIPLTCP